MTKSRLLVSLLLLVVTAGPLRLQRERPGAAALIEKLVALAEPRLVQGVILE